MYFSFPFPSVYIFAGGGGAVSNTEQSCVKTPGCTMYRSLYSRLFVFVAVLYGACAVLSDIAVVGIILARVQKQYFKKISLYSSR